MPKLAHHTQDVFPDWNRERRRSGRFEPWKHLLHALRRYQRWAKHPYLSGLRRLWVPVHRFWSVVCSCDIPLNAQLGGGLMLTHPNGVVIHPEARIGVNCLILQQVTIGTGPKPGLPEVDSGVLIGAGAKILGGIRVGRGARIGANAVVLDDVPPFTSAVGIPAVIKRAEVAL